MKYRDQKRNSNHKHHAAKPFMAALLFFWSSALVAGEPATKTPPIGATVEEFLLEAQKMNPELAAAALEADAAAARVQATGALPDPKFQLTLDEISENKNGFPGRVAVEKLTLQQELPWWGKRDLQRAIAQAESQEVQGKYEDVAAQIALRIKTAYADYHRVHLSMDQTDELIQILRTLVQFAQFRYAQGMGSQVEVTSAEVERGALTVEQVRLSKERGRIRARLNALVNREPDAPVVEHPMLRPLPPPSAIEHDTLLRRTQARNSALTMAKARTLAARQDQGLAEKAWYPDVNVSFGLVQRRNPGEENGFEAMVGFDVPVQWQVLRARELAATAKANAAQAQLAYEQLSVNASLRETLLSLEEAREVAQVTTDTLLPQARIALQSALNGYQIGTTEAVAVLDAIQRLKKFEIDLLKTQFEAQVRLAEIERLIGSDL